MSHVLCLVLTLLSEGSREEPMGNPRLVPNLILLSSYHIQPMFSAPPRDPEFTGLVGSGMFGTTLLYMNCTLMQG